ncbi:ACP S-malonyltransferase [Niveispirillum fermenti]|uniref:ACP S-malonyltransferase n=1 Tax=Niveispirillum fermenti TaxID=1233113 RepID=UPI003A856F0A
MGLGILCSGQGGQHAGMLDVLAGEPATQRIFDRAAAAGWDDPRRLVAGDPARLTRNRVAQPLLCLVQAAAWAALAPLLPPPLAVAGYSIGELTAYHVAGALALDPLLALASARAGAMDAAMARTGEAGAMLAVRGLDRPTLLSFGGEIAIANGPDRYVIGGTAGHVALLRDRLEAAGAAVTAIAVDIASHTSMMAPAVAPFHAALAAAPFTAPLCPVLAGIDGAPVFHPDRARASLASQLVRTVEWAACLDGLRERGCTLLLELGPGDALSRMAQSHLPGMPVRALADFRSLRGAAAWVERQST